MAPLDSNNTNMKQMLTPVEEQFLLDCIPTDTETGAIIYQKLGGKLKVKNIDFSSLKPSIDALLDAQKQYEKSWDAFFENVPLLEIGRFWKMVDKLKELIVERMPTNSSLATDRAIDEFFRLAQTEATFYTFGEAVQFAKTWDELKSKLYDVLFNIVTDKGDDGYGDLMDSLPLAGPLVYEQCVNKILKNNKDIIKSLGLAFKGDEKMVKFVFHGENYFRMRLEEEAKKRTQYQDL